MKIDIQSHYFPKRFFDEATTLNPSYAALRPFVEKMLDIGNRLSAMDKVGIDIQVLSCPYQSEGIGERKAADLTRMINDGISEICNKYPDRFRGLASISLNAGEEAVKELKRAVDDLGMRGVALTSNYNGKRLDSTEFMPFFEEANKIKLPIFIHPTTPIGAEVMQDYYLIPVVGFVFETTLTVSRMIFSGFFNKFKDISFILPHMGGTLPYLFYRLDWGFKDNPACQVNISIPPSEYLKKFYYDTAIVDDKVIQFCIDRVGVDHLVFAADFPFGTDFMSITISMIEKLNLSREDKDKIYCGNLKKIMKI